MKREKILFVITKSSWGGAGKYVYDLATRLSATGWDVVVALGDAGTSSGVPDSLTTRLTAAGIRTIPLHLTQRTGLFATLVTFTPLFRLIKIMRAERADVVHVNSAKAGGLGALAGRIAHVPHIVFTAHGWSFLEARNPLSRALIYFFSWLTAFLSHAVIVVSAHDLAIGRRFPFCGRKMHLIYNGIDLNMPFGTGERIRNAFPAGVSITGTIGELTRNKNHHALIEEARRDRDMHVAIVGEGEERASLEAEIAACGLAERVKLFGFMPVREVMRGFDTFVLPSRKEGLPYVLLEARAAGLPIRANRVGGVAEILDAPDLSRFSIEHMVEQTEALYRRAY